MRRARVLLVPIYRSGFEPGKAENRIEDQFAKVYLTAGYEVATPVTHRV